MMEGHQRNHIGKNVYIQNEIMKYEKTWSIQKLVRIFKDQIFMWKTYSFYKEYII